jgi:hypothetical protein
MVCVTRDCPRLFVFLAALFASLRAELCCLPLLTLVVSAPLTQASYFNYVCLSYSTLLLYAIYSC